MKERLMAFAASLIAKSGRLSAKPLCVVFFHQPKVPAQFLEK